MTELTRLGKPINRERGRANRLVTAPTKSQEDEPLKKPTTNTTSREHGRDRTLWTIPVLLASLGLVILFFQVQAVAPDPHPYFTANTDIVTSTPTRTVMEGALLRHIAATNDTLDAALYGFDRLSIREALIAAHQRGVVVRLVTDDEAYATDPVYADLEAAGILIVPDNRSSLMHNKFFIFDEQVVWSGSTNMTNNDFTRNHNNTLVFTSTQLANIYTTEFEEMFVQHRFGTAKMDNGNHHLVYQGIPLEVYFSPSDEAMEELLAEVARATQTIHFAIFYLTEDRLRDLLLQKIQEGVVVQGVWDALGAGNAYSDDEALCAAGAYIKIDDFPGLLHHKFMIIDAASADATVITGSMNWSRAGDVANDENTLILHDPLTAQVYLAAYEELFEAVGEGRYCGPPLPAPLTRLYLPLIVQRP